MGFRWSAPIVALALVSAALAGCIGSPDHDEAPGGDRVEADKDEPDDDAQDPDAPGDTRLIDPKAVELEMFRFPLERPVKNELWRNGSFEGQQTGLGGGFVTGEFVQVVELGELVPALTPTRIELSVTIEAEEIPLVGPTARADPEGNGTHWYAKHTKKPGPGQLEMGGIVKRAQDGTFNVVLEAYVPGHVDPPEVRYTVQAKAQAHPEAVPPGVPVALDVTRNESIVFQTEGDGHAELLIYDGDDALIDRLYFHDREHWTVPAGVDGELVVLQASGPGDLRIGKKTDDAPEGNLRALDLQRETGQAHQVEPFETMQWTFTVDERPLQVLLTLSAPPGEPWVCFGVIHLTLSSPQDTLLTRSVECPSPTNVPFMYEESWSWASLLGDTRLVAGTYQVSVQSDLWQGYEVAHSIERYVR